MCVKYLKLHEHVATCNLYNVTHTHRYVELPCQVFAARINEKIPEFRQLLAWEVECYLDVAEDWEVVEFDTDPGVLARIYRPVRDTYLKTRLRTAVRTE